MRTLRARANMVHVCVPISLWRTKNMNTFTKRTTAMTNAVSSNQTQNQKPEIVSGTGPHMELQCGTTLAVKNAKALTARVKTGSKLFARTSQRIAKSTLEVSHGKALFLPCYRYKSNRSKHQAAA